MLATLNAIGGLRIYFLLDRSTQRQPSLERPLTLDDVKPGCWGHWGTTRD